MTAYFHNRCSCETESSLDLTSILCRVHLTTISSIFLNIPLTSLSHSSKAQLPPLKPARTTAAVILMPQWYCLRHTHHIVAKLNVNRKASCTLAQRHQKDNSICPTSSGELKPIQATQTSDFPSLSSGFRTSIRW